jgi:DNA-binding LytR/AlgR family response regulator
MKTLKCLVIDDESMARKLTEENIRQIPFLEYAGACKNAFEAMQFLQTNAVDLLFLDIQMPGMLGTAFLQSLPVKPMVIFITAYSNFAVESYDLDVVDYLLKPVSLERFTKAAYKALDLHNQKEALAQRSTEPPPEIILPDFFFVHVEYSLVKITIAEIAYIESMKDYVKIFLTDQRKPILTKSTLKNIEEKLPGKKFMRVHKSYIVNLEKIERIRNKEIQIGTAEIPVGEANWEELTHILNFGK